MTLILASASLFAVKMDFQYKLHRSTLCYFIVLITKFCFFQNVSSADNNPPNIIFILADDLGWDDVGFHGSEIKTPNIDRLASEGVILNNYYVQPICTPTRSAILTGKYPIHTGLQHGVIQGAVPYGLPLNITTLPQHLKSEFGYEAHAVGKWHLGFFKEAYLPENRGFDSFLGYYNGREDYFDHHFHFTGQEGLDFHYNNQPLWNYSEVYSTEIFTNRAVSIIKHHDTSTPLFIYFAHHAVHAADFDRIQAPQKYIDRFDYITDMRRKYFAGAVSAIDDSIGAIYQSLVDAGMADNTVIVFSTDNGGPTNGREENAACNWPLRGSKATLWQGGVHVLGFVHSPLLATQGYVNENLMHASDWLPTFLSLAARRSSKKNSDLSSLINGIDGVDQWDVLSLNKSTQRNEVLLNIDPLSHNEAIIVGDFKMIRGESCHGEYDGWYPPPAHKKPAIDQSRKSENKKLSAMKFESYKLLKAIRDGKKLRKDDKPIVRMIRKYEQLTGNSWPIDENASSSLLFTPQNDHHRYDYLKTRSPSDFQKVVRVKCGPKPVNASTNCDLRKAPCLFNLRDDPCEYQNLANIRPDVLEKLDQRLDFYHQTMVKPLNKPQDPRGNPALHGGVWRPWL